jgi:hypothetical protein
MPTLPLFCVLLFDCNWTKKSLCFRLRKKICQRIWLICFCPTKDDVNLKIVAKKIILFFWWIFIQGEVQQQSLIDQLKNCKGKKSRVKNWIIFKNYFDLHFFNEYHFNSSSFGILYKYRLSNRVGQGSIILEGITLNINWKKEGQ